MCMCHMTSFMSSFLITRLTEVCQLCELLHGRPESFQTEFSPGKDKGQVTEKQIREEFSFLDEPFL